MKTRYAYYKGRSFCMWLAALMQLLTGAALLLHDIDVGYDFWTPEDLRMKIG